MSEGIQFDEDRAIYASRIQAATNKAGESGMVKWLMDKGYAKTPGMANGILIGVMIFNIIIAIVIIKFLL